MRSKDPTNQLTSRGPVYGAGFEVPFELDDTPALAEALSRMDLVEIIPEGFFHGKRSRLLKLLGTSGVPVVVHSIDMSLGTDEPLRVAHLEQIRRVIDQVNCIYFSDHICMTRAGGAEIGQLTTLPFTEAAADVFCRNVDGVRQHLGASVDLMFENITNRFVAPHSSLSEPAFLNMITRKSGAGLLLDVTNAYTNSVNFGFDIRAFIDELDSSSIEGIHLAGGEWENGKLYDTHSRTVPSEVWAAYDYVVSKATPRAVVIEWDQDPPTVDVLLGEVARAARSLGRTVAAAPAGATAGAERRFKTIRTLSPQRDATPRVDVVAEGASIS